jgi:hypothetical protein
MKRRLSDIEQDEARAEAWLRSNARALDAPVPDTDSPRKIGRDPMADERDFSETSDETEALMDGPPGASYEELQEKEIRKLRRADRGQDPVAWEVGLEEE